MFLHLWVLLQTLADSLFAAVRPDSATVAGGIAVLLSKIPNWPPALTTVALAGLTSLALDLIEQGFLKLADLAKRVPMLGGVLGYVAAVWRSNPKIINPLATVALGWLAAGNPLIGVLASGVRSMVKPALTAAAQRKVRMGALLFALGLALMAAPSSSWAQDPPPAPADTTRAVPGKGTLEAILALIPNLPEKMTLGLGGGYAYEWTGALASEAPAPLPWLGVRAGYIVAGNAKLELAVRRIVKDLDSSPHWRCEAGFWLIY